MYCITLEVDLCPPDKIVLFVYIKPRHKIKLRTTYFHLNNVVYFSGGLFVHEYFFPVELVDHICVNNIEPVAFLHSGIVYTR